MVTYISVQNENRNVIICVLLFIEQPRKIITDATLSMRILIDCCPATKYLNTWRMALPEE
jgi:hypothetical protein